MGIFWHIIVKICRYTIFQARFSTYQAYIKKAHPKDLIWNSPSVLHFAQVVIWTLPAHTRIQYASKAQKSTIFWVFLHSYHQYYNFSWPVCTSIMSIITKVCVSDYVFVTLQYLRPFKFWFLNSCQNEAFL